MIFGVSLNSSNVSNPPLCLHVCWLVLGRLILGFDATYLFQTLAQLSLGGVRGLVGGAWTAGTNNSFKSMEDQELSPATIQKASVMMQFMVWSATAKQKCPLTIASVPLDQAFTGDTGGSSRAQWAMVDLVGRVLEANGGCVRGMVFDHHGSHNLIRKLLHGHEIGIPEEQRLKLAFWGSIKYQSLPPNDLPRLPIRIAFVDDEPIWGLCGPCFWV